jgi:EAL domain-containing protein (putative c-di-GMP-specific phosphodiesterase class I)
MDVVNTETLDDIYFTGGFMEKFTDEDIKELIYLRTETKNLDYKEKMNWLNAPKENKIGIIKDILAMANTLGGGKILFGIQDSMFEFVGISDEEFQSFDPTKINDLLHQYSDPKFSCEVYKREIDNKKIVIIDVPEFVEIPIICRKDFHSPSTNQHVIKQGQIYIRTNKGTSESISSADEMRDLLERATKTKSDELILIIEGLINNRKAETINEDKARKQLEKLFYDFIQGVVNQSVNQSTVATRPFDISFGDFAFRNKLRSELDQAINNNEFFILYQPIINLERKVVSGVEALIRWKHPEYGIIKPKDFIPLAVEQGLIGKIDVWVLDKVLNMLSVIKKTVQVEKLRMSINISTRDSLSEIITYIRGINENERVVVDNLLIEIPENVILSEDIIELLSAGGKFGLKFAIDNFGTGYSSLSYLKQLPISFLKIDNSFTENLNDPNNQAIVSAIIQLSEVLKMTVIAVGVETNEQLSYLKEVNCKEVQGYYYHQPIEEKCLNEEISRINQNMRGNKRRLTPYSRFGPIGPRSGRS